MFLRISPFKHMRSFFAHLTCLLLMSFYLPFVNLIPSAFFIFSNEEDKQILRLRLIMEIILDACQVLSV